MASVSSTSSLGNTSLRGFGGMVSGIDRDEIIEQMTLGTTTKISNAEKDITKLEWKQEAFRSISDKIIGLSDDYFSFSSPSSLVDPTVFAKNLITVHGSEKSSKYVTASGTSDLVGNVSVKEVRNLASAAVLKSDAHVKGALRTELSDFESTMLSESLLKDTFLTFGVYTENNAQSPWSNEYKFTFASQCQKRDNDGNVVKNEKGDPVMETIDYVLPEDATEEQYTNLVRQLNNLLKDKDSDIKFGETKISDAIQFTYDKDTRKIGIKELKATGYSINKNSSALSALGYNGSENSSIAISTLNSNLKANNLQENAIARTNLVDGLTNKEVTFNYNGSQKKIALLTKEEAEDIKKIKLTDAAGNPLSDAELEQAKADRIKIMIDGLQSRLDHAYGKGNVKVSKDAKGNIQFETADESSSVSITSGDDAVLKGLGIEYGASSRLNMDASINKNKDNLGLAAELSDDVFAQGITINGVTIKGITKDTSISDILSKINKSNAGVKATYVEATGQFMLVSSETGKNRKIEVGKNGEASQTELEKALFGINSATEAKYKGDSVDGKDATIVVSYGNGVDVELSRSSNSFNLEGLTVTVSGVFGGEWAKDENGNIKKDADGKDIWNSDSADAVTFTAKADVDKATERVKSFFEAFNELVEEVNGQLTTRPDSDYGPLTDEQKDEMSETSIENWEKKAKQGILFGDSSIRDLSGDIQGIFTKLMNDGASYDDLNKIGITYSSDYKDGGKLVFDEAKFRAAMESEPELVSKIFTGGDGVGTGLTKIMEKTFTPYATRYASDNAVSYGQRGSYGRLIEEAGSEKAPTTLFNNFIYNQIKDIQNRITTLRSQLVTQQDRYIKQFSSMESLISQMNSQSSWLSQITG